MANATIKTPRSTLINGFHLNTHDKPLRLDTAEASGDKARAQQYYAALLTSTDNGAQSARPEFAL